MITDYFSGSKKKVSTTTINDQNNQPAVDTTATANALSKMAIAKLKDIGIQVTGTKPVLIERICACKQFDPSTLPAPEVLGRTQMNEDEIMALHGWCAADMTVVVLQQRCRERFISAHGTKQQLISRLAPTLEELNKQCSSRGVIPVSKLKKDVVDCLMAHLAQEASDAKNCIPVQGVACDIKLIATNLNYCKEVPSDDDCENYGLVFDPNWGVTLLARAVVAGNYKDVCTLLRSGACPLFRDFKEGLHETALQKAQMGLRYTDSGLLQIGPERVCNSVIVSRLKHRRNLMRIIALLEIAEPYFSCCEKESHGPDKNNFCLTNKAKMHLRYHQPTTPSVYLIAINEYISNNEFVNAEDLQFSKDKRVEWQTRVDLHSLKIAENAKKQALKIAENAKKNKERKRESDDRKERKRAKNRRRKQRKAEAKFNALNTSNSQLPLPLPQHQVPNPKRARDEISTIKIEIKSEIKVENAKPIKIARL